MRRQWLSAVAAAALIGGIPAAYAQDPPPAQGEVYVDPDTGPGPDQVCPPGQVCPDAGGGVVIDPDTGPGPDQLPPEGQAAQQPVEEAPPAEGQAAQEEAAPAEGQTAEQPLPEDQQQQAGQESDQIKPGDEPATTGSVDPQLEINDEQTAELRTEVKELNVAPIDVDFQINIGIEIPRTVVLHPLPPRFIEVVPAYADYQFFILADGTIIIVDPVTWRIVYVLYA
jgi:hypothetical protein